MISVVICMPRGQLKVYFERTRTLKQTNNKHNESCETKVITVCLTKNKTNKDLLNKDLLNKD